MTEDEFICQIRTLLPEGDVWNTTLPTKAPEAGTTAIGAAAVGCMRVGCEQLVFGSCCAAVAIPCDDEAVAPQLAIVDAFAAVAYKAVLQLCDMLKELDPCTAEKTIRRWGERFGLVSDNPCDPQWSDRTVSALICVMLEIKRHPMNLAYLEALAARFGAEVVVREAGDMNCGPTGWWTMARDRAECPLPAACPPEARPDWSSVIRMHPGCEGLPLSLNLITAPSEIRLPDNCNLTPPDKVLPHDPELYAAFKWLLPKILPQPAFWCIYERRPAECIQ
jgi:hypothetical protein